MLKKAVTRLTNFFKLFKEVGIRRRRRKLALLAELEAKERKTVVDELTKKLAAARADCERNDKTFTKIDLSVKEISFIEGDLRTWNRYFKEREIYRPELKKPTSTPPRRTMNLSPLGR